MPIKTAGYSNFPILNILSSLEHSQQGPAYPWSYLLQILDLLCQGLVMRSEDCSRGLCSVRHNHAMPNESSWKCRTNVCVYSYFKSAPICVGPSNGPPWYFEAVPSPMSRPPHWIHFYKSTVCVRLSNGPPWSFEAAPRPSPGHQPTGDTNTLRDETRNLEQLLCNYHHSREFCINGMWYISTLALAHRQSRQQFADVFEYNKK